MTIIRYDPFRYLPSISDNAHRIFDVFRPTLWEEEEAASVGWRPRVDIYDQEGNAVIQAELPGITKEDVDINVRGNTLTLRGSRKADTKIAEGDYYCKERFFGSFQRSITLPAPIDPESVEATFRNGVLKVVVPKPKEMETKKIQIS